jgi:hypothetical protein
MDENAPILSSDTLNAIEDETLRAWQKHRNHSMTNPNLPTMERLAILGEEFGEVCKALTYDSGEGSDELKKELIQLATMAACWADCLRK